MAEQESQSKVLSEGISELLNRLREQQNSSGSIEIENLLYESLSNSENGEVPMLFRELESMVAASTSNNTVDDISNIVSTLLSNINNAPPAVPVTDEDTTVQPPVVSASTGGGGFSWLDLDGPFPASPFLAIPAAVEELKSSEQDLRVKALTDLQEFDVEDVMSCGNHWQELLKQMKRSLESCFSNTQQCLRAHEVKCAAELHLKWFKRAAPRPAAELVENVIAALSTLCRTCEMCCTSQATLHSVDRIDVWLLFQLLSLLLTKVPEHFRFLPEKVTESIIDSLCTLLLSTPNLTNNAPILLGDKNGPKHVDSSSSVHLILLQPFHLLAVFDAHGLWYQQFACRLPSNLLKKMTDQLLPIMLKQSEELSKCKKRTPDPLKIPTSPNCMDTTTPITSPNQERESPDPTSSMSHCLIRLDLTDSGGGGGGDRVGRVVGIGEIEQKQLCFAVSFLGISTMFLRGHMSAYDQTESVADDQEPIEASEGSDERVVVNLDADDMRKKCISELVHHFMFSRMSTNDECEVCEEGEWDRVDLISMKYLKQLASYDTTCGIVIHQLLSPLLSSNGRPFLQQLRSSLSSSPIKPLSDLIEPTAVNVSDRNERTSISTIEPQFFTKLINILEEACRCEWNESTHGLFCSFMVQVISFSSVKTMDSDALPVNRLCTIVHRLVSGVGDIDLVMKQGALNLIDLIFTQNSPPNKVKETDAQQQLLQALCDGLAATATGTALLHSNNMIGPTASRCSKRVLETLQTFHSQNNTHSMNNSWDDCHVSGQDATILRNCILHSQGIESLQQGTKELENTTPSLMSWLINDWLKNLRSDSSDECLTLFVDHIDDWQQCSAFEPLSLLLSIIATPSISIQFQQQYQQCNDTLYDMLCKLVTNAANSIHQLISTKKMSFFIDEKDSSSDQQAMLEVEETEIGQITDLLILEACCMNQDNVLFLKSTFPNLVIPLESLSMAISDPSLVIYLRLHALLEESTGTNRGNTLDLVTNTSASEWKHVVLNEGGWVIHHRTSAEDSTQKVLNEDNDVVSNTKRLCVEDQLQHLLPVAWSSNNLSSTITSSTLSNKHDSLHARLQSYGRSITGSGGQGSTSIDWFVLVLSHLINKEEEVEDILKHLNNNCVGINHIWFASTPISSLTQDDLKFPILQTVSMVERCLYKCFPTSFYHLMVIRFPLTSFLYRTIRQCWVGILNLNQCLNAMSLLLKHGLIKGYIMVAVFVCRHLSDNLLDKCSFEPYSSSFSQQLKVDARLDQFDLTQEVDAMFAMHEQHSDWIQSSLF